MGGAEARVYDRQQCVSFRKTDGKFGGLSNMAPGFPLKVNGVAIRTAEALYQACRFPHLPKVQRLIIDERSPMTAKMKSKPYRSQSRSDWDAVRVRIMRWCLRVKLVQHWDKFSGLLLATGDQPIVEDSRKDDFWGAKPQGDGTLIGGNVLGRLLMELREQLHDPGRSGLRRVEPPTIPNFLLCERSIETIDLRPGSDMAAAPRDLFSAGEVRVAAVDSLSAAGAPAVPTRSSVINTPSDEATQIQVVDAMRTYPKRLIEVDLPIRRISEHARREKSIRHGHISTLHLWWARRPLAACRAVILASLWPDPADCRVSSAYREEAAKQLGTFRARRGAPQLALGDPEVLRSALLDFIAEFSNWDHAANADFLSAARAITAAAGVEIANSPVPVVLDPFAGGGAIPFEASRVGAEPFASDLNPVAVLLNKVAVEYVPRFGQGLAEEVRHWGAWVLEKARKELDALYPPGPKERRSPIAYLWARTIRCEGPSCGAEVPLVRSYVLAKKGARYTALAPSVDQKAKSIKFTIAYAKPGGADGTVRGGSAVCPVCGFTTANARVRAQLAERRGGATDARLLAVVTTRPGEQGRQYRVPTSSDFEGVASAVRLADRFRRDGEVPLDPIPTARPSPNARGMSAVTRMGVETFADLYAPRQLAAIATFARLVREASQHIQEKHDAARAEAICTCVALAVDRIADASSSLATWSNTGEFIRFTFARQALAIVWDFAECNPVADASGNWAGAIEWIGKAIDVMALGAARGGTVQRASATKHPLPDDSVDAVVTDPPYYDAVPYADLSEYFFVWLKQSLRKVHPDLLEKTLPKDDEAIWNPSRIYSVTGKPKDERFYENQMRLAFAEARRVAKANGVAVVVFAHKSTAGWEAVLGALLDAGWVATASWPIDTERSARTNAIGTASLGSSVHIVCRPREMGDGQWAKDAVGDWRAVLGELPGRIHEWLPRLAEEGIVGADAIFACLGPALEIFSRYARVEKASGEAVTLREYLEHVWAAVSREALSMIFDNVETAGLEEDARLTAMWLWTLAAPGAAASDTQEGGLNEEEADGDRDESSSAAGFSLEFDAARKIAQGLGARLDEIAHVVEVKGDKARLLAVHERAKHLFGKTEGVPHARKAGRKKQIPLFGELEEAAEAQGWGEVGAPKGGTTTLDRVHQAMLLFGSGRGEALKRFLVEEGVGKQPQFWKLAQSLSALYPSGSDEKRWVDGVVARKKGLGFG